MGGMTHFLAAAAPFRANWEAKKSARAAARLRLQVGRINQKAAIQAGKRSF
jgi:hypothetical protein